MSKVELHEDFLNRIARLKRNIEADTEFAVAIAMEEAKDWALSNYPWNPPGEISKYPWQWTTTGFAAESIFPYTATSSSSPNFPSRTRPNTKVLLKGEFYREVEYYTEARPVPYVGTGKVIGVLTMTAYYAQYLQAWERATIQKDPVVVRAIADRKYEVKRTIRERLLDQIQLSARGRY